MVGNWIKYKCDEQHNENTLFDFIECIELREPHQAGEIIDNYWLILTNPEIINISDCTDQDNLYGIYDTGTWVRIIDIRQLDLFETDFDYKDRKDLQWYRSEARILGYNQQKIAKVNMYSYIG